MNYVYPRGTEKPGIIVNPRHMASSLKSRKDPGILMVSTRSHRLEGEREVDGT